jgi:hypothetical protein
MNPAIASRIPLVCRHKPPGAPLDARVSELIAQTAEPASAGHSERVARASGVFNFAALIASDTGLPDLAADLCWRQYKIFAEARSLAPDIAVMALMPLVNIARLLLREGNGNGAFDVLQQLYRAARDRGSTAIRGHSIDLAPSTQSITGHRKVCEELWAALLIDGSRALAHAGRWAEAAEIMTGHRGIGNRLLDGRQIKIIALLEKGLTEQATAMIESTIPVEPWENTVAALLRICCRQQGTPMSQKELKHVVEETLELVTQPEPTTAVFRVRVGLTALDLAADRTTTAAARLRAAVIDIACSDAYAARDILGHDMMRAQLTLQQEYQLAATRTVAGLGTGSLPSAHMEALTAAVSQAGARLQILLGSQREKERIDRLVPQELSGVYRDTALPRAPGPEVLGGGR